MQNLKKCPPNKNFSKVLKQRLTKRSKEFVTFDESDHPLSELVVDLFNENAKALDREFKGGLFSFLDENPTAAIHGDLCLSNILYCERRGEYFLVDPNGARNTPIIYDWAKLSHSILGKYDLIISDQFF